MKANMISQFIRSCIFFIVVPVFTMFWSFICLAVYPLPLRMRHRVVMVWTNTVISLLKVICKIDYRFEGLDNIPKERNGIIMCKHQSSWETFILPGMFNQTAIILKRELYWVPFFGWGMLSTDPIAINRKQGSSAMAQILQQGKKYLQAGRWVLVFPEGTRIAPGKVGKYRIGGALLSVESGYPILPVAHNAGEFWSRRQFIKKPGTVRMVFGPLIEPKGHTAEEVLKLTQDWIETTMKKIEGSTGAS
ncbi:MAG: lysophospholipid acyltransferase family protein [Gammaproteobacteria bacterium]|nr:lysophospholipid acyltransferase family protein [Gammaproteobacteria bacterium]